MPPPDLRDVADHGFRFRPLVIAAVAVVACLTAGCTSASSTATPASSGTMPSPGSSTTDSDSPAAFTDAPCPRPNYPGNPALDFGPTVTCGFLTVPENRSDPTGRTIRLAVARVPAVSDVGDAEPVVYLQGGPGESALLLSGRSIDAGINADRDVIYLEQRGNFHSEPNLVCPEVEAYLTASVSEHFSDPATGKKSDAATTACRDRLTASGIDLAAYNTVENAADVADLRVALGIDVWNVYGTSYGTDLALRVLRDHPEGIRSVVLDSVVPPNVNPVSEFWPSFAAAYRQVFDGCAAQPACAAAYPNLAEDFTTTVNRLSEQPLTVVVPDANGDPTEVNIDGYRFANLVGIALASGPASAAVVPGLIDQMAEGDGTAVATALLGTASPMPGVNADGFTWSASCPDWTAGTSPEEALAKAKTALPDISDAVLSLQPQLARYFADCAIWNVGESPASARAPVVSEVPVLLMGGTFDSVTAIYWQDALKPGLTNAQSVSFPGLGHTVVDQSPCAMSVMQAFLASPDTPVDQTCAAQMAIPTFTTPG